MTVEERKKSHDTYMPTLDGVRGLAALLVIASHIGKEFDLNYLPINYFIGSSGVLLFFALSGFLMGTLYFGKPFNEANAAKYVIARATRIAPAYLIAVMTAWVLYQVIPDFDYQMTPLMMLRSVFFASNQGVFWSIPPEIQFYGFFLLIWLCYERAKTEKYTGLTLLTVLAFVMIATRDLWGGLVLASKFHIFLSGFLASVLCRHPLFAKMTAHKLFQILIIVATLAHIKFFITEKTLYSDLLLGALVGLCVASVRVKTPLTWIFQTAPMRFIGNASFSIYLFHDQIINALIHFMPGDGYPLFWNVAIAIVICVTLPIIFYALVERHLTLWSKVQATELYQKIRNRFSGRPVVI